MKSNARINAYKKGSWAESFASLYFLSKGYKQLKRRYKTRYGEIDLILQKKNLIVFVEVKARKNIEDALHSIHAKNRSRIENAAQQFLAENPDLSSSEMRMDAFCIAMNKSIVPIQYVHLDNAWLSGS